MQVTCPNCQTLNRPGGKFCLRCGRLLFIAATALIVILLLGGAR